MGCQADLTVLMRKEAGVNRTSRRTANGVGYEGISEHNALAGKIIQVGSVHIFNSIAAQIGTIVLGYY